MSLTTRERLLNHATEAFARSGYEGASVNQIVDAAGVNKRMVYHYFGDKRGLFEEVFRGCWQELGLALQKAGESGELLDYLGALFDTMAEQPHFARLMMWEGLEGGALSRSLWAETSGPMFSAVEAAILEGQAGGQLDSNLHPGHLVVSILGAVCHYFAYAGSLEDLIGSSPLTSEALAERRGQVLLLLSLLVK